VREKEEEEEEEEEKKKKSKMTKKNFESLVILSESHCRKFSKTHCLLTTHNHKNNGRQQRRHINNLFYFFFPFSKTWKKKTEKKIRKKYKATYYSALPPPRLPCPCTFGPPAAGFDPPHPIFVDSFFLLSFLTLFVVFFFRCVIKRRTEMRNFRRSEGKLGIEN
jgi:hypothetical protein